MMEGMRRLWVGLGVGLVAVIGYLLMNSGGRRDGGPEYVTVPVERGPIRATVTATGTVNPVATVQVGTYVSGPITEIHADFNTAVSKGQLLAMIYGWGRWYAVPSVTIERLFVMPPSRFRLAPAGKNAKGRAFQTGC